MMNRPRHQVFRISTAVLLAALPAAGAFAATTEIDVVTATDGAAGDWFGSSVNIDGTLAIVGARYDDIPSYNGAGSAYLIDGIDGSQIAKLTASDGRADDSFGMSVGISSTLAIVGAQWDNHHFLTDAGSAYLFDATATSDSTEVAKLTASDAAANDWFGRSVDISGPIAIVGAVYDQHGGRAKAGSAYLFDATVTTNSTEVAKLTASDRAAEDQFGVSLAIDGNTAVVGAWLDDYSSKTDAGSVYVFDSTVTTNSTETRKITPDAADISADDHFGISVDVSGALTIVGARDDDDPTAGTDAGSAYLFDVNTGTQLYKLTASDAASGDQFGQFVSISGRTAVVGARHNDDSGTSSGSAYLFDTSSGSEIAKITASNAGAEDRFGTRVAISGTSTLVGATREDTNGTDSGASYLFNTDVGTSQVAKPQADDAVAGDQYGGAVAINGAIGIIGARHDDDNGVSSGSAYLVDTSAKNTVGDQIIKLTASDAEAGDEFGASVAISNTNSLAIVGAISDDHSGKTDAGSAYLFDTTATSDSTEVRKLTASDADAGDRFGVSVGIDGDYAIVGADLNGDHGASSGSAYLFDTSDGTELDKLTASDAAGGDRFGESVSISGNIAIVGARFANQTSKADAGKAYLFDIDGTELDILTASDAATEDEFGTSVAISGTTAIVGAPKNDDDGTSSGSAYLFDALDGSQLFKLTASDAGASQFFGHSVSISGTTAVVGAWNDNDKGAASGSSYLFDVTDGSQIAKLTADDGAAGDRFGFTVGISGTTTIVGGHLNDDDGIDSGSAYIYDIGSSSSFASSSLSSSESITSPLFAPQGQIEGGSIAFSAVTVGASVNLDDIISLEITGEAGSILEILDFTITGPGADFYDLPTFTSVLLSIGEGTISSIAYDLTFLGGNVGDYDAVLAMNTNAGSVVYNLSASAVPEPGAALLLASGFCYLLGRSHRLA